MDLKKIEIKIDKNGFENVVITLAPYDKVEVKYETGFSTSAIKDRFIENLKFLFKEYLEGMGRLNRKSKQLDLFGRETEREIFLKLIEDDKSLDVEIEIAEKSLKEEEGDSDVGISEEV